MNFKEIGLFIKELRKEKGYTQDQLAMKIFCDRSKIAKIESGNQCIKLDDLLQISEVFDVNVDELISGRRKTRENEKQIQILFKEYLKAQNTKFKRMKLTLVIFIIVLLFMFSIFASIYFINNYSSIRTYRFYGETKNYVLKDSLLLISKNKVYMNINSIEPSVNKIKLYSEINGKKKLIYEGSTNTLLFDFYGYESLLSYEKFLNKRQKFYLEVNDEVMELNFVEDFKNNDFFYYKLK